MEFDKFMDDILVKENSKKVVRKESTKEDDSTQRKLQNRYSENPKNRIRYERKK